jgi:putative Holliday junction resolvase
MVGSTTVGNPVRRVIAFDYGTRSIGVANGQVVTGTASELPPLKADNGVPRWPEVQALLDIWQPDLVLVGLPLNMDGTESELAKRARKFANRIHGRFGYPVALYDERLSTREAKQEARERGHRGSYRDNPVDSIAARLILESWWREKGL